jgi:UDP-GlcNAc:undecaprenyl-phosphate GlcNAc-1-phosphate transferase
MTFESLTILLATAGISMVLCVILTPVARRIGLLDHPSDRTVHKKPTPLVGGLAIYIAFVLTICLATPYGAQALPLLAACGLLLITGMLDDLCELSAKTRFGIMRNFSEARLGGFL